uniref:Uncharacterized protein n=1 Tax=Arundo donax TaxID=35708 RepID=A0A0A9HGE6_ARUDO
MDAKLPAFHGVLIRWFMSFSCGKVSFMFCFQL